MGLIACITVYYMYIYRRTTSVNSLHVWKYMHNIPAEFTMARTFCNDPSEVRPTQIWLYLIFSVLKIQCLISKSARSNVCGVPDLVLLIVAWTTIQIRPKLNKLSHLIIASFWSEQTMQMHCEHRSRICPILFG